MKLKKLNSLNIKNISDNKKKEDKNLYDRIQSFIKEY